MLQAQLVIHAPDRPCRAPEVAEFFLAVQRGRIYDDVVMDMVFIHMGTDNKSMVQQAAHSNKTKVNKEQAR